MLATAVSFATIVLAVHILAVVFAFGAVLGFPVITLIARRVDQRAMPALHHVRVIVSRALVHPGLLFVFIAGLYLAAHLHQFGYFYVWWGIGAVFVLGGLDGAAAAGAKQLAELGARDVAGSAGEGEVEWSSDYVSLRTRADVAGGVMALLVAGTIVVMTLHV